MSRVDRYKHIHENAEQQRKKEQSNGFNPRRVQDEEIHEDFVYRDTYQDEYYDTNEDYYEDEYYEEPYNEPQARSGQPPTKKGRPKNKKKRPKKRRGWRRFFFWLLILLLVISGYSTIMFLKGKSAAENDTSLPKESVEEFNGVTSANGAKNILILGSDTRGEDAGRADTIMVLQLNGPSKKPKLVSFMRDTFVDIPGVGANKINSAYAYGGAELVRQTLLENFGIDCKYYAKVDFQSFEKIVDSLFPNGVKIDAEKTLNLDGVDITKGEQVMDGHVLLQYARFRMDEEGDFGRVRRQQQVMNAVVGQLKNPMTFLRTPESLGKMIGYMSTNVPTSFMLANGPSLLLKGSKGVERLTVPVEDSWEFAESDYAGSILQIDAEKNQTAIQNFLN